MNHQMAKTKNVMRFLAAVRALQERPAGVEGMAILWGEPGEGKSTTVAYACNAMDGVFLRAQRRWKCGSMLGALMIELGMEKERFIDPMMDAVVETLTKSPRPIFIDEADYLFCRTDMLDVLRDIYDITGAPVILIGMEEFARKVQARGKFARRITQWVEFCGIDLEDAAETAKTVTDITIAEDLLAHIHAEARANIGRMVTAFARTQQFARTNGLDAVTRADWGHRALFYDQPNFKKKRRIA